MAGGGDAIIRAMRAQNQTGGKILVVVAEMGHNTQREIAGVSEYARHNGIAVDIVEGRHFGGRPNFAKWIEFWRPDGMIVDSEYARVALSDVSASALPLVVWDASRDGDLPARCARVLSDPQAIAEAAARELLRTAFPRFAMGCSRRLADLRFRQATGRTILDEIHARRLDKAKALLKRGDVPIGALSEQCGYVPGPSLGLLFKRATGRTMRQWRRECSDEFR